MNRSSWAKLTVLGFTLTMPLLANGDGFVSGMQQGADAANQMIYGGQQQDEELKRQQIQNEMLRQQLEQQRLETQRRTDEYNRQKEEQEDQEQKQKSVDLRLDEMQKKLADQEALQKQLAESQAREAALSKEVDALKRSKAPKSKKKKNRSNEMPNTTNHAEQP